MIAIIGAGPAGVSCALYIARANIPVIIFTNHKSSLLKAKSIENYYGVGKIPGEELYYKGIEDLKKFNIPIYEEEVLNIIWEEKFIIETNKNNYSIDSVVLATGSSKKAPNISNLANLEGKGVSYCATCDGFFFKNKKVAVLGSEDFALHEINYLKNIVSEVVLVTNGKSIETDNSISKIETPIKEILGDNKVDGILFEDDRKLEVDGIFVANNYPDSNILAKKVGILTIDGEINVNHSMETNIPKIFACGDAVKGTKQVAKAVQDGMQVAFQIIQDYKKEQTRN